MAQKRRTFLKGLAAFGATIAGIPSAHAAETIPELLEALKDEPNLFTLGDKYEFYEEEGGFLIRRPEWGQPDPLKKIITYLKKRATAQEKEKHTPLIKKLNTIYDVREMFCQVATHLLVLSKEKYWALAHNSNIRNNNQKLSAEEITKFKSVGEDAACRVLDILSANKNFQQVITYKEILSKEQIANLKAIALNLEKEAEQLRQKYKKIKV
ncbi:MAG: hypothetical protein WC595_03625 [Candidatus Nanoarchaeia archaeon]